jgi:hypothetical protein
VGAAEGTGSPLGIAVQGVADTGTTHDHAKYRQTGQAGYAQRPWEPGIPTGLGADS